jgi:hypothetical protein
MSRRPKSLPKPLTVADLVGQWSHGIVHGYFGGSHDFRFVFLSDGRGCFIHDGWWTYRYAEFQWKLNGRELIFVKQRYRDFGTLSNKRCLQIDGSPSLRFDKRQNRRRLDLPLIDEPHDFYLVTRDVQATELHPEYLKAGCNGPLF